ncbi:MAG: exodeoxyribonuclease VII large subunit [Alphaproteobacteria bacterium]|nr:exodeoxyribonuclease VII large subunit [Alphaproteobacteria bacterium]MCL2758585.1 exodeoxyribonuclease VII large subunit [Alphaproteobacteria bacterium]
MTLPKLEPFVKPDMVFSVSDAAALLKGVVETAFPVIKIRGELSQITRATSGHIYMTIKDTAAAISVIIWRGTPVNFNLADGLEVIVTGKFTTYPARSNYQIVVSEIEMAGAGAILKMLEERKRKLSAEGLFDVARKRTLPRFPGVIGIVTSPTGAAFQDIQNRLRERFPVRVMLYPAQVQGDAAAKEVAAGIEYFNKQKNVDVIIVARGGGSLEDLLPFSEEIVVRAVAASEIPIVSGVGHEPDWMLVDFAADVRAPTPTGAAEIVVPTKISIIAEIENLSHRLTNGFISRLQSFRHIIAGLAVKSPKQMIMERAQRLDDIGARMNIILQNKMNTARQSIAHAAQMLSSLSYKNVLGRGFAIVRHDGKIVSKSAEFKAPAEIEFADGAVNIPPC